MFQEVIDKLKETEKEIKELKSDKAKAEQFLSLVMSHIGELEIDLANLNKVDYEKVRVLPDEENRLKVKVLYCKE